MRTLNARASFPQAGFTLLEVLIVTLLLFMLSMALFKSVRDTIQTKADVDQTTETLQGARAALALLERDLRAAYTLTADDMGWDPPAPDPTKPPEDQIPIPPKPLPVTIFQGKPNEIFMSTRTHQRLAQDASEDNEHFVTYQLDGKDLVRGESSRAASLSDREDPSRFRSFAVLSNVSHFTLSYWDHKAEKWTDSWDTENGDTKDSLPDAVKIELEFMPEATENNRRKIEPVKIQTAVHLAQPGFKPAPSETLPTGIPNMFGQTGGSTGGSPSTGGGSPSASGGGGSGISTPGAAGSGTGGGP